LSGADSLTDDGPLLGIVFAPALPFDFFPALSGADSLTEEGSAAECAVTANDAPINATIAAPAMEAAFMSILLVCVRAVWLAARGAAFVVPAYRA
jgi:hypothetical protein